MRECGADRGEGKAVGDREDDREEEGRVVVVERLVQRVLVSENASDIVVVAGVVERMGRQDWQVLRIPSIREVQGRCDDPEEEHCPIWAPSR